VTAKTVQEDASAKSEYSTAALLNPSPKIEYLFLKMFSVNLRTLLVWAVRPPGCVRTAKRGSAMRWLVGPGESARVGNEDGAVDMRVNCLNLDGDGTAQVIPIHRSFPPAIHVGDAGPRPHPSDIRRVVVAGKSATIVEALAVALAQQAGVEVLATASNWEVALDLLGEHPDSIVMYSPELDVETIELAGTMRDHAGDGLRVVLLAGEPSLPLLAHAATVGVASYLSLNAGLRQLTEAIRAESTGAMLLDPSSLVLAGSGSRNGGAAAGGSALSRRELEVLAMLAEGCSAQAIAAHLFISIYTARGHIKNVLRKLGAHSQLEAVAAGRRMGILRPSVAADETDVRGGDDEVGDANASVGAGVPAGRML
jgi:DNA-binding NarL/FixJ family response regulator